MRLLFLSVMSPWPSNNGHKLRNWANLQALAEEGHEITLVSFADPGEIDCAREPLRGLCRSLCLLPHHLKSLSDLHDYAGRVRSLASALPYGVSRFQSTSMERAIGSLLERRAVEAIFCETPYPVINLPRTLPVPLILDCHNLEHLLLGRFAAVAANPLKRVYAAIEARKMRRWERQCCARAATVLACSAHDSTLIRGMCPGAEVQVAPNVVDIGRYAAEPSNAECVVLYLGGMDWYPNRDAVRFFACEILPSIRKRFPEVRFVVAGRGPSASFLRTFRGIGGIEFTGTLADLRCEMARATMSVVPLRVGSGTRLKILEAAAMGKPIVSTRIGAEGLDFADGAEILLADGPEEFAAAVVTVLADRARGAELGRAARRRVELQYSMAALRDALRRAVPMGHPEKTECREEVRR